jgi:quercetin dioxygenase-like cupin family protein
MTDTPASSSQPAHPIPPDDPRGQLVLVKPDEDASLRHIGLVGDTYTTLLTGADTGGRYCLIDMHVPPGGGPPPHRHDFDEMFTVLDGEIEATFRGEKVLVRAGQTVNIPPNAPHAFTNAADKPARLLCLCSPSGLEEFFAAVSGREPDHAAAQTQHGRTGGVPEKAEALAPKYRLELLKP